MNFDVHEYVELLEIKYWGDDDKYRKIATALEFKFADKMREWQCKERSIEYVERIRVD